MSKSSRFFYPQLLLVNKALPWSPKEFNYNELIETHAVLQRIVAQSKKVFFTADAHRHAHDSIKKAERNLGKGCLVNFKTLN